MAEKSSSPTPTMIMLIGKAEALFKRVSQSQNCTSMDDLDEPDNGSNGLIEIGNDSVGDDEENKVLASILESTGKLGNMVDDWSKVGGTIERHVLQSRGIGCQQSIHAIAIRVVWSKIEEELVGDLKIRTKF